MKTVKILCDTGATGPIINHNLIKNLRPKHQATNTWSTLARFFKTKANREINFTMPELHCNKAVQLTAHVTKQPMQWDVILGEDMLKELGFIINYRDETMVCHTLSLLTDASATILKTYGMITSMAPRSLQHN